jgi:hypothetical protein
MNKFKKARWVANLEKNRKKLKIKKSKIKNPKSHLPSDVPKLSPDISFLGLGTASALHCTALHCTALHCTALHCTALRTLLHNNSMKMNERECTDCLLTPSVKI